MFVIVDKVDWLAAAASGTWDNKQMKLLDNNSKDMAGTSLYADDYFDCHS